MHAKRVRTPTIIQVEATECGAVSLGIVLAYYHKYVPIEELRIACNVTRDGSNAWNLSQAAESYGFEVHGYSVDLDQLQTIELPAILFWEFDHFLVLEGWGKDCYYVNDPRHGSRRLTIEEFSGSFTGLVLELKPNQNFLPSGKPLSFRRLLGDQFRPVKSSIFFILLTQLGILIPTLSLAALSQIFIDQIFVSHTFKWIEGIFLSIGLTILVTSILIYLQTKAFVYLQAKLSLSMASRTLWHLLRLPISFFMHRFTGEVASRANLIESVTKTITGNLAFTILDCFLVFAFGIAIFYYSFLIGIVAVIAAILNILLLRYIFRNRQDNVARYQAAMMYGSAFSFELLVNIETVKSMALESRYFSIWTGFYTKAANAVIDIAKKDILLGILSPFFNSIAIMALIGIGGMQVLSGKLTIGMLTALQILIVHFLSPIARLMMFSQTIQFLKIDMARLNDIVDCPIDKEFIQEAHSSVNSSSASMPLEGGLDGSEEQVAVEETGIILDPAKQALMSASGYQKLEGYIEFKNVQFGYSHLESPLIEDISINIHPGKSVAIVGKTGCGKSTLAMLLAGLIQPWKGEILLDGKPRSAHPRHMLTSSISLIEQSPYIFRGSIRDNIVLFNPFIHQDEVVAAAKDACVHEEIMERKNGYDLELIDGGSNISGGQRQRIEIARGLLKKPTLLILDECTSTLDSEVEEKVIRNVHRRGCAVLMIAHRLSSVKKCDEICVMDEGKIIAKGTHEQLKKSCPLYCQLINLEEEPAL